MRKILLMSSLLACVAAAPASAQAVRFSSVSVDAAPIAAKGYPTFAQRVEHAMAPAVEQAFAGAIDRSDPRGLRLVLRVISVDLPVVNNAAGSENDIMRSEALVLDRQGRVVARTSVLSPVPAFTVSASLPIEIEEQRRMEQLGVHAAFWLRKRLAGL